MLCLSPCVCCVCVCVCLVVRYRSEIARSLGGSFDTAISTPPPPSPFFCTQVAHINVQATADVPVFSWHRDSQPLVIITYGGSWWATCTMRWKPRLTFFPRASASALPFLFFHNSMLSDPPEDAQGGKTLIRYKDGTEGGLDFPAAGYAYILQVCTRESLVVVRMASVDRSFAVHVIMFHSVE